MTTFVYKTCKDCGASKVRCRQFYRVSGRSRDGYMNSCKDCHKQNVSENLEAKAEFYRAQKREISARPYYVAQRATYIKSERGRQVRRAIVRRYRRFRALEARA